MIATPVVAWVVAVAPVVLGLAATAAGVGSGSEALLLERGAVATQQIVGLGRDVIVAGDALAGVTALDGSATISGSVAGDLTVLGGNATLAAGAVVRGSVHVLGGRLAVAPGARIGGRSIAYPTFSRAWTTLLEGPSLGLAPGSPVMLAAKLGLIAAWLVATIGLCALAGRGIATASDEIRHQPLICFSSGLVAVFAAFLSVLLLSQLVPSPLSLPLVVLVALAAIFARLWGVVALFHALGRALLGWAGRRRAPLLDAAVVGLTLLAIVKFVPWVGAAAWTAATFVGVGSALRTGFGRREAALATRDPLLSPSP